MDNDVVYISDDDDHADGNAIEAGARPGAGAGDGIDAGIDGDAGARARARQRPRHPVYHLNVYERYEPVPPSVQATLESMHLNEKQEKLKKLQELQVSIPRNEDIVYVPDDNEEEDLLIGPIRRIFHQILFGKNIFAPLEFSYESLTEIENHLSSSLKNVSFTTEKNVWDCVLDGLSVMPMTFKHQIDVCYFLRLFIHCPF